MADISACMRCGSADLRVPGLRDGVLVGQAQDFGRWSCNRCGLTATPILFDDEAARLEYEAERAKDPDRSWPATGWPAFHRPRKP